MMAKYHMNPLTTNSLVEMYESAKNNTSIIINELDMNGNELVVQRVGQNIMSLKVAAEMSIQLIESTNP